MSRYRDALILVVDFNRRFSPLVTELRGALKGRAEPLSMMMTVHAGKLPPDSWVMDESEGGGRVTSEVCHFIDLFVAVAGAPVTSIGATPLREGSHEAQTVMFSLTLGDGSIGTIHYLANSSRKLPKERFEVNSDGRTVVIDNFRGLKSFGFKKIKSRKLWSQQKGHRQCIEAFLGAVKGEKIELPSFEEIKNVTVATILAKESLRNGGVLVVGA